MIVLEGAQLEREGSGLVNYGGFSGYSHYLNYLSGVFSQHLTTGPLKGVRPASLSQSLGSFRGTLSPDSAIGPAAERWSPGDLPSRQGPSLDTLAQLRGFGSQVGKLLAGTELSSSLYKSGGKGIWSPGKLQPKTLTPFLEKPRELSHYLLINTSGAEILVDGMPLCVLA